MITAKLQGGLGNMLFQIATAYALALRHSDNAIFSLYTNSPFPHKLPNSYKDNIFRKLTSGTISSPNTYSEPTFHYTEIPYVNFKNGICLDGYFQSAKYFDDYYKEIVKLFEPSDEIINYILDKYGSIFNLNEVVSIHVRHGDYLKYPNHHPILNLKYYNEAARYFDFKYRNIKYLVFSDDINWCKENFDHNKCIFIEEEDYIEFYLMSFCHHNIIANSSFSWWGAYLNTNINKEIIAPNNWFGKKYSHISTKDLIPEEWILL